MTEPTTMHARETQPTTTSADEPAAEHAIAVDGLKKSYGPDGLTFSVPRGVISAFVGPNGSGKTTTLRILMGFAHASAGTATVLGEQADASQRLFRRVAFVAELKELYPFARAGEMIRLTRGFYPDWDHALERRLVDELEVPLKKNCAKLSKGVKAKLWLLLALCRRAELLVLDEPTDGLDPIAIEQALRLLVEQVAERGATVFFSSHQLSEVEQIADHVVMIKRGRCVAEGEIDAIRQRYHRVRLLVRSADAAIPTAFSDWRRDGRFLTGYSSHDAEKLRERLNGTGIEVVEAEPATLKEIFLDRMARA